MLSSGEHCVSKTTRLVLLQLHGFHSRILIPCFSFNIVKIQSASHTPEQVFFDQLLLSKHTVMLTMSADG